MKNKLFRFALLAFAVLMLVPSVAVSAATPYQTHTFMSGGGYALYSPDAYVPSKAYGYADIGMDADFGDVSDLFVSETQKIYIVDSTKNQVVVLDRYYNYEGKITTFVNNQGVADSLTAPKGVFVKGDYIYVCDTNANRIVVFSSKVNASGSYDFIRIIPKPTSNLFGEDAIYKPVAMVVDDYNRFYVISSSTYQGVIVMTEDGTFSGFIGAQHVTYNLAELFWRRFQTEDQRAQTKDYIPTEYNNISITNDDNNFIYVTSDSIDESSQRSSRTSKSGTYAPVKLLNASGAEIMRRNGAYDPGGDVTGNVSKIVDVAVGPENTWSIIDRTRSKCYTYDFNGYLLFAFGDTGSQLGNVKSATAVAYQGDKLIILDASLKNFTVYKRTEYGDTIISALANTNNRQYDKARDYWQEILKRNSNYDAAYVGIGQAYYRDGNYEEAMEYYKSAYDTANYSDAFKEIRKEWISKFILLIPVGAIVLIVLFVKFMGYAKKVNTRTALKIGRRTFTEEILYAFHCIMHPFDGFWDLKHERRGSVRAAIAIYLFTVVAYFYNSIGRGYIVNKYGSYSTIFSQFQSVLVPVILFVVANWCLTTLFDGEGSFKDIFVATAYAIVPLPIFVIISTIMSNFVTNDEKELVTMCTTIGLIWAGLLIFFGTMVTHDYSLGKNVIMILSTIVGMAVIMAVAFIFSALCGKMVSFVSNIIVELSYRM